MEQRQATAVGADEIDLRAVMNTLWEGRLTIAGLTALGVMLAVAYALLATEVYRSEALVQPRQESRAGTGLGSLAAQFGGLTDFAGVTLGGGGDRAVAIATLKSRALIESFIEERKLLPKLYATKWDAATGAWKDPERAPTAWQGYNDFRKTIFQVTEDKKTGLVTVAVEWRDPVEAAQWVADLIARTNAHLKDEAIRDGERNLAYLQDQSRKIGQVELQQSLYSLVETEMKKVMIARGGEEFALKTIDPAVVPKKKIRPNRTLVAIAGFLLGGLVGAALVVGRRSFLSPA